MPEHKMPTLPFNQVATLQDPKGTVIASVPVAIWPATGVNRDVGRVYDHEGQAPQSFYAQLTAAPNRVLIVGGTRYRIVSAMLNEFMPHVSLMLREVRPGGQG